MPMASSVSWGSDLHYAKNSLGLTTFDLNYDILFCSYSITITPIKNSRAPDDAYIILQCGFLGTVNYSTG